MQGSCKMIIGEENVPVCWAHKKHNQIWRVIMKKGRGTALFAAVMATAMTIMGCSAPQEGSGNSTAVEGEEKREEK